LELARLGLVQGETQNYVLKMACKYIELGLKFYPKDAGFYFQYGQALLKLRKYQQAYEQFKKAESFGIDREKLLVYYAELAFYRQNYLEVRDIMKTLDFPTAHPQLSTIANFWQKTPNAATAQR
jgi:tetratricopeptide (TPR) repeat protein